MDYNDEVFINSYGDEAYSQLSLIQSRLTEVENSFYSRINGKTTSSIVGSLIISIVWLVVYEGSAILVKDRVDMRLLIVAIVITILLILFMLIDGIMEHSYYGKISSYNDEIAQLQNRISIGINSIETNYNMLMNTKEDGWNFSLYASKSIIEEEINIETVMTQMESLKKGFVSNAKTFFYYASAVAIAFVGSVALFPEGSSIINELTSGKASGDAVMIINVIAMLIAVIGEVIIARLVWSKTDCDVNNTTLLITMAGPIAYIALIVVGALIVMLVMFVVGIIIAIIGVVIAGVILFSSISGG